MGSSGGPARRAPRMRSELKPFGGGKGCQPRGPWRPVGARPRADPREVASGGTMRSMGLGDTFKTGYGEGVAKSRATPEDKQAGQDAKHAAKPAKRDETKAMREAARVECEHRQGVREAKRETKQAERDEKLRPPALGEGGALFVGEEGLAAGSYAVVYPDRIERSKRYRVAPPEVVFLRGVDGVKVTLRKYATSEVVVHLSGREETYAFNKVAEAEMFHATVLRLVGERPG